MGEENTQADGLAQQWVDPEGEYLSLLEMGQLINALIADKALLDLLEENATEIEHVDAGDKHGTTVTEWGPHIPITLREALGAARTAQQPPNAQNPECAPEKP